MDLHAAPLAVHNRLCRSCWGVGLADRPYWGHPQTQL